MVGTPALLNKEGYYECNATRLTAREVEGMVKPHRRLIS